MIEYNCKVVERGTTVTASLSGEFCDENLDGILREGIAKVDPVGVSAVRSQPDTQLTIIQTCVKINHTRTSSLNFNA
jgi:hypothetical protein